MRFFLLLFAITISACDTRTKIDIKSTPEGAMVNESTRGALGSTPTQIVFSDDDCPDDDSMCMASFYFSKQGYEPKRVERVVTGEHLTVHAYLTPLKTNLYVSVYPGFATINAYYQKVDGSWSKLSLTGKVGNTLSLNDEAVWEGRDRFSVRLNIESSGYLPIEKHITVNKGEQTKHEYVLEEYAINGYIESSPSEVDVYEKSLGYLGRTPFSIRIPYDQLVRISPQRRPKLDDPVYLFLEAKKAGYQTIHKTITINETNESEKPTPFNTLIQLPSIQKKH